MNTSAIHAKDPSKALDRLAEQFVCQLAAEAHVDPPAGWYLAMEDIVRDQVESTILSLDIQSPGEWAAEIDDDAADHERARSAGL